MNRWLNYAWSTSHFFFVINLLMMWNSGFLVFVLAEPGDKQWLKAIWWAGTTISAFGYVGLRFIRNRNRKRLDTDPVYYFRHLRWDSSVSKIASFVYGGILFHVLGLSAEVSVWLVKHAGLRETVAHGFGTIASWTISGIIGNAAYDLIRRLTGRRRSVPGERTDEKDTARPGP